MFVARAGAQVQFVMKDGQVFKRDGVMAPSAFFNAK